MKEHIETPRKMTPTFGVRQSNCRLGGREVHFAGEKLHPADGGTRSNFTTPMAWCSTPKAQPWAGLLVLTVLLLTGCTTIPFESMPTADYSDVDEKIVIQQFADLIPRKAEVLESVVFSVFGKKIVALGYVSADEESGLFVLSCMNPAGVRLFQVKSEAGVSSGEFMMDIPAADEKAIAAVAEDVRRMHSDWAPSPQAELTRKKDRLIFTDTHDNGRTEFVFMGPEHLLAEKRYYTGRKLVARVRLFEYQPHDGYIYPSGIVLENKRFRYRLMAKIKRLHVLE